MEGDPITEAETNLLPTQRGSDDARDGHTAGHDRHNATRIAVPVGDRGDAGDSEQSPLLAGGAREDGDIDDFAHLPWWRRPSFVWVLAPFFLMACAFGGVIAPKANLILDLVCREYYAERMLLDPSFTMMPVDFNGGSNDQCRVDEVASRAAQIQLWGNLLSGILAAIISPKLGALSDRYGRKPMLITTSVGTILGEIVFVFAALYPETFPSSLLLLSFALDGMTGTVVVAMSISSAYATDCTPPSRRNTVFGFFHACLFTGIAIGPILAGYVVKISHKVVIIFYIMTAVHIGFVVFIGLFVPESLSGRRQQLAREKHELTKTPKDRNRTWISHLRIVNTLEPLHILLPTGPGSSPALRRNLVLLAATETIIYSVAMGAMAVLIYYVNLQFGWKEFESGRYLTIVNGFRTFILLAVLPLLTRLFQGSRDRNGRDQSKGADVFDLSVIRVSIIFDMLGYLGFTLARSGVLFTLAGMVSAMGGIGLPTLQAALTKHVPADRTGQLLGAMGLLQALARIVAPTAFNAIFVATVHNYRQTVFACLTATFGLAFLVSLLVRPHVYYDEEPIVRSSTEEEQDEA